MATRPVTVERIDVNTVTFEWTLLTTANNDGEPIPYQWSDYVDRTVQVEGTFGAGGNLRIEGALQTEEAPVYRALNDPFGAALNITAASVKGITEVVASQRPNVTAGDGTTSLTVTIFARRARSGKAV